MPPGMIENPTVVDRCPISIFSTPRNSPFQESLSGESCPLRTQIGIVTVRGSFPGSARTFGLFNLTPPPGFPSLIGASPFGVPLTFSSRVRSANGEYGLTLEAHDIAQRLDITGLKMTLWGNPWLVQHDLQRGDCLNEVDPENGFGVAGSLEDEPPAAPPPDYEEGTCSTGNPKTFKPLAYLTLPTSCGESAVSVEASSWQQSASLVRSQPMEFFGCDPNTLRTMASVVPTTDRAGSSSGLDFNLDVDQTSLVDNVTERGRLLPELRAPSQVKRAIVTLPDGVTVNPSVAAGLGVCTPAQFDAETIASAPGAGCPNASKIGEMTVRTPLLQEPVQGALFLAEPYGNPFGTLLALYLVAKAPDRGVIVKVAGRVDADPHSGRLVAAFDNLPQLPYSHLNVHFRDSQRSPLATPSSCGVYGTQIDLFPWLEPNRAFRRGTQFQLVHGVAGGPCPTGTPPFNPKANSGTLNRNTGSFTPFYLHLTRGDDEQEITSYSATLPKGLLGAIKGVPFCPESAIQAAARNDGFAETANPSCPEASKIGRTTAGYGLGNVLAYAPGNLYLAGPYNGSPLSVVAVDSATVGPFDLGVIIVRSAIRVDPVTAQVSIDSAGSDPIPHIIKGIPLHLRDIRVYIDRPNFMLNPTSCERFGVSSTLNGSGNSFSNPADDSLASVTNPFQVSFCSSLEFKPRIDLRLKGGTKRGKYPSLTATVAPRAGDANIGRAEVTLPPSIFLAQNHIETICTRAQSQAGKCPPGSIYGKARAITPLMEEPLEGPVYLRASANKLPDLVADLTGRGIRIEIAGRIDSKDGGMRATYDVLPDAPVSKFTLTLNGGKRGLLVNSDNVCKEAKGTARMAGQNNKGIVLKPTVLSPSCKGKAKKKPKSKKNPTEKKGAEK
ncbi:MAG TPA: hypothetical protein VFX85_08895 [Solirubrobacterales bacterium]|nr:hypothetical protein [Solirubrobacterales bacterium]